MKRCCIFGIFMGLMAGMILCAAAAVELDGIVGNAEWVDAPKIDLIRSGEDSLCLISDAAMRYEVSANMVCFGFTAHAPGITAGAPFGAALLVGDQIIARWQQGMDVEYDSANYSLQGAGHVPEEDAINSYSFELALGCKTSAALQALQALQIRLFDPAGEPSRQISCSLALPFDSAAAEGVVTTTTTKTTTTKTTTTKTTTIKSTTTKASTTARTTTKMFTTAKATTTKTSTAMAAFNLTNSTAAPAAASSESAAVFPQTSAAASATIFFSTGGAAAKNDSSYQTGGYAQTAPPAVWTTATFPASTEPEPDPTLWTVEPETTILPSATEILTSQEAAPPSQRGPLLYAAAGFLLLLASILLFFWVKAQKSQEDEEAPAPAHAVEPAEQAEDFPEDLPEDWAEEWEELDSEGT